jgi:hypothetical protein
VVRRNFFMPLKAVPMDGAEPSSEGSSSTSEANESLDKGRPTPIVLTSEANLLSVQKELKTVVAGEFLQNTAPESMVDYRAT